MSLKDLDSTINVNRILNIWTISTITKTKCWTKEYIVNDSMHQNEKKSEIDIYKSYYHGWLASEQ